MRQTMTVARLAGVRKSAVRSAAALALVILVSGCVFFHPAPESPLALAAAEGRAEDIRALLGGGADPDDGGSRGITPLMWAARAGRVESIDALVGGGARIDVRDHHVNGWTALLHAIHKGNGAAAQRLLDLGADPGRAAGNGTTPLVMAAGSGDLDLVRDLLDRGADPCAGSAGHLNALTGAVAGGNVEIVRLILERAPGLRLNGDMEGFGARAAAWLRGDEEILRLVAGASAGSQPGEGCGRSRATSRNGS